MEIALSASQDRDEIFSFLKGPGSAGDRFTAELQDAVLHLRRFPGTAVKRRDLTHHNVFFWFMSPYFPVVARTDSLLSLIASLHCSRNIRRELRHRLGKAAR